MEPIFIIQLFITFKSATMKRQVEVYHSSFTSAVEEVLSFTTERGFEVDSDDWQTQVALGGRYTRSRPAVGETHRFTVSLIKDGKEQRKCLSFQVYGMESGKYELNAYIN